MSDRRAADPATTEFSLDALDYELPPELIAQAPAQCRESARLLVANRRDQTIDDRTIEDLPGLLDPNDLLVMNDTKVVPAKLALRRATGGRVRGLFLEERGVGVWRVMLEGSRRLRVRERLSPFADGAKEVAIELVESHGQGEWTVRVSPEAPAEVVLERIGRTPLPPYIKRDDAFDVDREDREDREDRARYQTVYASRAGAVAAPTAGLHFSEDLLAAIASRGIATAFVTLHVGMGTFKPIDADRIVDHRMHSERFELTDPAVQVLNVRRARGGRIVAVGTTSVRVLETAVPQDKAAALWSPQRGDTDIFIYPPYRFRGVDALLTNFHLPRSTLLALVMAFGGVDFLRACYAHAVEQRYRFYSYGDAMLIV